MKIKSKDIAVCAVAVALMFALAWMPVAAFLIPVLFVACNYKWRAGLIIGIFAGGVCLMYSFLIGAGSTEAVPQTVAWLCAIMVVPRALTGVFASLAFTGAKKLIKNGGKVKSVLPYNLAASAGVVTNTVLVVTALALLVPDITFFGAAAGDIWWVLVLVGLSELIVVNLFVPVLCLTVGKALKIGEFAPKKEEWKAESKPEAAEAETAQDTGESIAQNK